MSPTQSQDVLKTIAGLWPDKWTPEQLSAIVPALARIDIDATQARYALNALFTESKRFLTPADILQRLRVAEGASRNQREGDNARPTDDQRKAEVEAQWEDHRRHADFTRRWVREMPDDDLAALLVVARAQPIIGGLYNDMNRDRLLTRAYARGFLYAIEKQERAKV